LIPCGHSYKPASQRQNFLLKRQVTILFRIAPLVLPHPLRKATIVEAGAVPIATTAEAAAAD
jgi:hypothetical protein